jgi:hypothetical protein
MKQLQVLKEMLANPANIPIYLDLIAEEFGQTHDPEWAMWFQKIRASASSIDLY